MNLSYKNLKEYLEAKGGMSISPKADHLMDLKDLYHNMIEVRDQPAPETGSGHNAGTTCPSFIKKLYPGPEISFADIHDYAKQLPSETCGSHIDKTCYCVDRTSYPVCECNARTNTCECLSRTASAACECDSRTNSCDCNDRTGAIACQCNSRTNTCNCRTRTSGDQCTCNSRTSPTCPTRTAENSCRCNSRTLACDCQNRTACSCNSNTPTCDCNARTGCDCQSRTAPCDCQSRTALATCTCNSRNTSTSTRRDDFVREFYGWSIRLRIDRTTRPSHGNHLIRARMYLERISTNWNINKNVTETHRIRIDGRDHFFKYNTSMPYQSGSLSYLMEDYSTTSTKTGNISVSGRATMNFTRTSTGTWIGNVTASGTISLPTIPQNCDCQSRTSRAACTCNRDGNVCTCNNRTTPVCSSRTGSCGTVLNACSCNSRTPCDCHTRTAVSACQCNARTGCDCQSRSSSAACECDARTGPCDCHSRTSASVCECDARHTPLCPSREAVPSCDCNARNSPLCPSRTSEPKCPCDGRCACNFEQRFE